MKKTIRARCAVPHESTDCGLAVFEGKTDLAPEQIRKRYNCDTVKMSCDNCPAYKEDTNESGGKNDHYI